MTQLRSLHKRATTPAPAATPLQQILHWVTARDQGCRRAQARVDAMGTHF